LYNYVICLQCTSSSFSFFCLMTRPPLRSTLFPYTTLFRSSCDPARKKSRSDWPTGWPCASGLATRCRPRLELERNQSRNRRGVRSEEHTSELQSLRHLVCRLLLEKKKKHICSRV